MKYLVIFLILTNIAFSKEKTIDEDIKSISYYGAYQFTILMAAASTLMVSKKVQ